MKSNRHNSNSIQHHHQPARFAFLVAFLFVTLVSAVTPSAAAGAAGLARSTSTGHR